MKSIKHMKITIEIRELQTLKIDDLSLRTGCSVSDLFQALYNKLLYDANNISYLNEAVKRTIHDHFEEEEQVNKLKKEIINRKLCTYGN